MPRDKSLEIQCPKCARKTRQPIADLTHKAHFACPACGALFDPKHDAFARAIIETEEDAAGVFASLDRLVRKDFE